MSTIVVTTQAELDDAIARQDSGLTIIIDSQFGVWLKLHETPSHLIARGDSWVKAKGSARLAARGHAQVSAWDQVHVEARDRVFVVAWDRVRVAAWDQVHIDAWGYQVRVDQRSNLATVVRHP